MAHAGNFAAYIERLIARDRPRICVVRGWAKQQKIALRGSGAQVIPILRNQSIAQRVNAGSDARTAIIDCT